MVVLVLMCLDLGLLNTDGLKEESIDGIVDIDSVDETEPRALNWFHVSSSYGWYVKLPAFFVCHIYSRSTIRCLFVGYLTQMHSVKTF
jgi:hypothetical protein